MMCIKKDKKLLFFIHGENINNFIMKAENNI